MKNTIGLLLALWLTACASAPETLPGREPDYVAAAKINTQLGIDYYKQGQTLLAIEKLEKALKQDGSLPATHAALGLAYGKIGEHAAADKAFKRALQLSDKDPDYLNNYGAYLCDRGESKQAQELFKRAARNKRYPTPEVAYTNAGSCARKHGDAARAEEFFRRALSVNPRHGEAMLQLASMSYEGRDFLRSRAFLERYEAWNAVTADSLLLGLRTEYALGDRAAAIEYGERLRQLVPGIGQHLNLATGEAR